MELKKSKKADLEWRKPTFVQIGLVIALLLVFLAFELVGTAEKTAPKVTNDTEIVQIVLPPPTIITPPPPPPPAITSIIEIVDNNTILIDDFPIDAGVYDEPYDDVIVEILPPKEEIDAPDAPLVFVEVYPEFPGGDAERVKFLRENLVYPQPARMADIEGKVWIGFVVEKDGSLSNFSVVRSVAPVLDEEALRVVKLMPKWTPGKQSSRTVRVQYQIPITFTLH